MMEGACDMGQLCPWCQSRMPYAASVCPHCTRSIDDWNRRITEAAIPKPSPPAHTLPCHACGAWVPSHLIGDSREGDRPGICPSCHSSLDSAYWAERAQRPRRCNCGIGRCWKCHGYKGAWIGLLWWTKWVPCEICEGRGTCNACNGTFIVSPDYC